MRRFLAPLSFAAALSPHVGAQVVPSPPADQVAPAPTTAQAGGLSLAQAVSLATGSNALLRSATLDVDAAEAGIQQASAVPNPVIGYEQEGTRKDNRTSTLQIAQPIELGGKRAARIRLAERTRDVAALDQADRQAEIRSNTTQAYFDALLAQERFRVAAEAVEIAQTGLSATSRRVVAGKVSPTEETRFRVAEATARSELAAARAEGAIASRALSALLPPAGTPPSQLDGDATTLPDPVNTATIEARLQQSPAWRKATADVDRLQAAYDLERAKAVPDITVSLGAQRAEQGRSQAVFGLSIPIPVFDRNQGAQLEALRRQESARAQAEATQLRLRTAAFTAAEQVAARREEAELLKAEVLPGARSALDTTRRGYELGKFSLLDVLDAQRAWLQARLQYLRALADAHRANNELDRLLQQASTPTTTDASPSNAQKG